MDRDARPICVGYVRPCPARQDEDHQREVLGAWYWGRAYKDYVWGGFYRDPAKAPNELRRRGRKRHRASYMWTRRGCEQLREELWAGDMLIACSLGVLCNDVTDALEGLPSLIHRPVKIVLTEDNVELTSEALYLLRAQQRDWLMEPTKSISKTPPLGMRRDGNKWSPAVKELRYMRWAYRRLVLSHLPPEDVLEAAQKSLIHPRTKRPPAHINTLRHAANAYHDVMAVIQMGEEVPRWVRVAQAKGFFNENITEICAARADGIDPFHGDEPRVPVREEPSALPNGVSGNGMGIPKVSL